VDTRAGAEFVRATLQRLIQAVRKNERLHRKEPEKAQELLAELGDWCAEKQGRQSEVARAIGATPQASIYRQIYAGNGIGGVHPGLSCFYLCPSADAHYANPANLCSFVPLAIANERSTGANPI